MASPDNTEDRLRAALVDRYRIEERIGRGGMATVYRAEDRKHDREVAIKVLDAGPAEAIGTDRFLREIRTTARLAHPHILPLFDSGEARGLLYYVMPYKEGESLRDRLARERRLPLDDAVQIAGEVSDALVYAHDRGVIHRDVKPGNILLDAGHAVLSDFGIAQAFAGADETRLTETGVFLGTPAYMSPEQASGEHELDGRADQYALACVLYEMLVGEPPFTGPNSQAVLLRHLSAQVPSITTLRSAVPWVVVQAVRRALGKAPDDRFPSTRAFRDALLTESVDPEPSRSSIAVLPFTNMSADPENEYFSDGITEEIINSLCRLEGLRVIARTSSFAFKGKNTDVREIGRTLKVTHVLEGSVRRAGDRVRVTAQLVQVSDGFHLWSGRFDRVLEDVFAIQDEVSLAIADSLRLHLLESEGIRPAKHYTADIDAYNSFLLGRHSVAKIREEDIRSGIRHLENAIDRDAHYAHAMAAVSHAHFMLGFFSHQVPRDAFQRAKEYALRAVQLDQDLAEAHSALGLIETYLDWNWSAAELAFKRALLLNPSSASSHQWYAYFLVAICDLEKAVDEARRGLDLNPLSAESFGALSWCLLRAGRHREAEAYLERMLEHETRAHVIHWLLGQIDMKESRVGQGIKRIEEALDLAPDDAMIAAALGWAYGVAGRGADARGILRRLDALSREKYVDHYFYTKVFTGLGEKDKAFEHLGKAVSAREMGVTTSLGDETLDSLRSDSRFPEFLERVGLSRIPERPDESGA